MTKNHVRNLVVNGVINSIFVTPFIIVAFMISLGFGLASDPTKQVPPLWVLLFPVVTLYLLVWVVTIDEELRFSEDHY